MISWFPLTHFCVLLGAQLGVLNSKDFSRPTEKRSETEISERDLYPSRQSAKIFSGYSFAKVENVSENGGLIVKCGEKNWSILVKREFFGRGVPFSPRFIRLGVDGGSPGACAPLADFTTVSEMVISAGLQDCGSESRISGDWLIYSNKLVFSPGPLLTMDGVLIFRHAPTLVAIECRFKRKFRITGEPLSPTWLPMTSTIEAVGLLHFSFHIIKDESGFLRQSTVFQQGEPLLLEAAVHAPLHPPLQIYVDHCVATASSDPYSKPNYEFISNHGCLVDSLWPNSLSQFFRRPKESVLRFSIQAFNFPQDHRKQIFITCRLRAAPRQSPPNFQNKACYFHEPSLRWHETDGNNTVCLCCESGNCSRGIAGGQNKEIYQCGCRPTENFTFRLLQNWASHLRRHQSHLSSTWENLTHQLRCFLTDPSQSYRMYICVFSNFALLHSFDNKHGQWPAAILISAAREAS